MIAKLIVWGPDRPEALRRMRKALDQTQIVGLATNVAFLGRLVDSNAFRAADLDTGLIERHRNELFAPEPALDIAWIALAVASLIGQELDSTTADPWSRRNGWRLNGSAVRPFHFALGDERYTARLLYLKEGFRLRFNDVEASFALTNTDPTNLRVLVDGQVYAAQIQREGSIVHLFRAGRHVSLDWLDARAEVFESESEEHRLTAPMPGKVVAVLAKPGATVSRGTPLIVMEAMKMEHTIAAPGPGVVSEILFGVGDQVAEGAQLLVFEPKKAES
jgi:3-methylcrotonyl-CoA carboxylase alpha subunit